MTKVTQMNIEEDRTSCVISFYFASEESQKLIQYILDAHTYRREGEPLVDQHKRVFGRQDICWSGEYRYWIWVLETGLRIYVSNFQGVSLEMPEFSTFEDVKHAVDFYYEALKDGKKE